MKITQFLPINSDIYRVLLQTILVTFLYCTIGSTAYGQASCTSTCSAFAADEADFEGTTDATRKEQIYQKCLVDCQTEDQKIRGKAKSFLPAEQKEDPPATKSKNTSNEKTNETNCKESFDSAIVACETETKKAANICSEGSSPLSKASGVFSQVTLAVGQNRAMGIKESCSTMGKVASVANAALAAFRQGCMGQITACVSSCSVQLVSKCGDGSATLQSAKAALQGNQQTCQSLTSKTTEAQAAIQNFMATQTNAQYCENLNGGTPPDICKDNPNYQGCSEYASSDCNLPQNKDNKVCVCSKNPLDPRCQGEKLSKPIENPSRQMVNRLNTGENSNINSGDLKTNLEISQKEKSNVEGGIAVDLAFRS